VRERVDRGEERNRVGHKLVKHDILPQGYFLRNAEATACTRAALHAYATKPNMRLLKSVETDTESQGSLENLNEIYAGNLENLQ
jgi:hypothetical protein